MTSSAKAVERASVRLFSSRVGRAEGSHVTSMPSRSIREKSILRARSLKASAKSALNRRKRSKGTVSATSMLE